MLTYDRWVQRVLQASKRFTVQRALVAGAAFATTVVGARLVEQSVFSRLLFIIFLAKFMQLGSAGATTGYLVKTFSPSASQSLGTDAEFVNIMTAQLMLVAIAGGLLGAFFDPLYLWAAFCFLLLAPVYALEPVLRVQSIYSFSLVPDLALTCALAVCVVAIRIPGSGSVLGRLPIEAIFLLVVSLVSARFTLKRRRHHLKPSIPNRLALRNYRSTLADGFPAYFASALYSILIGIDRIFLPRHGDDTQIAVYLLSFQLGAGAMVLVAASNFQAGVEIGLAIREGDRSLRATMRQKQIQNAVVGGLSFAGISILSYLLEFGILSDYDGLTATTITIALGMTIFFHSGSISSVVLYYRRLWPPTLLMSAFVGVIFANNLLIGRSTGSIHRLSLVTAVCLSIYGVASIVFSYRVVDQLHYEVGDTPPHREHQ